MKVLDRSSPFVSGQLHFADKIIKMRDHRIHDLLETRVGVFGPRVEHNIGCIFFGQIARRRRLRELLI